MKAYYIAGPMTGIPRFNFPAFDEAARVLRDELRVAVISPSELDDDTARTAAWASDDGDPAAYAAATGETWGDFLSRDVKIVADLADGVVVLPGWSNSRGARLEVFVAQLCGKPVYSYDAWVYAGGELEEHRVSEETVLAVVGKCSLGTTAPAEGVETIWPDPDVLAATPCHGCDDQLAASLGITAEDTNPYLPHAAGEVRMTSATGGQKGRKPQRTDLIPPEFLLALSEVYGMGAEKYDDHNYLKGYDWSLSFGAMLRHVYAAQSGEWYDEESGLPHVLHAAWHCACLFMFEKHGLGTDDRISTVVEGVNP